jgi:hypothetical protein
MYFIYLPTHRVPAGWSYDPPLIPTLDSDLLQLQITQFSHCLRSEPLITDQTVQINSGVKSVKTISTTRFISDGSDLKQHDNCVKFDRMKSVSSPHYHYGDFLIASTRIISRLRGPKRDNFNGNPNL